LHGRRIEMRALIAVAAAVGAVASNAHAFGPCFAAMMAEQPKV